MIELGSGGKVVLVIIGIAVAIGGWLAGRNPNACKTWPHIYSAVLTAEEILDQLVKDGTVVIPGYATIKDQLAEANTKITDACKAGSTPTKEQIRVATEQARDLIAMASVRPGAQAAGSPDWKKATEQATRLHKWATKQ